MPQEEQYLNDFLPKEKIQNNINRLLVQVQKELKKKMFPRKHVKLLSNNVNISIEQMENGVLGYYKTIDNKENKYKFTHKIVINSSLYYEFELFGINRKRKLKRKIKNVIAHELIHAYVYENYELGSNSYGFHNDGSPIFLAILSFLNISSGHNTMLSFYHSKIYDKIITFKSFAQLEIYLIQLTILYEKTFSKLSVLQAGEKILINEFVFSCGVETGLIGHSTLIDYFQSDIIKTNLFIVGPNVSLSEFKTALIRKSENNLFHKKIPSLNHLNKEGLKNKEDLKNRLKIQTLNI